MYHCNRYDIVLSNLFLYAHFVNKMILEEPSEKTLKPKRQFKKTNGGTRGIRKAK